MNLEWLRLPYWCPGYIIWFSSAQRCGGCKCKFSVDFVFCGVEEESHPAEKCCLLCLSFEWMAWSKGWLAIWELFVVRYPFTTVAHYLARYIMCYVRAPVTAPLWLTAIDVIRWTKVFEAGHIGVSLAVSQIMSTLPNFMMGWNEKKPKRAGQRWGQALHLKTLNMKSLSGDVIFSHLKMYICTSIYLYLSAFI